MTHPVAIKSITSALPARRVHNHDAVFDAVRASLPGSWWDFWGIESRPLMDRQRDSAVSMGAAACQSALELAGLRATDVDLILVNLSSPLIAEGDARRMFPRLSEELRQKLGAANAVSWDVEMECLTFMLLLQLAAGFIRSGKYARILICSVETMSEILDFGSRDSTTFGDGAAAAVITADDIGGDLLAASWGSDAEFYDVATVRWRQPAQGGEQSVYFTLAPDGRKRMMDFVPKTVPTVVEGALRQAGLAASDIAQFIFHQPGRILIESWANGISRACGDITDRYPITLRHNGCLVSVAIPSTLVHALEHRLIAPGDHVLLGGLGTGWCYGAQVWRWGSTAFGTVAT
ncbi:MAG: 3-oxoacyl-ACP synthase III family protein [Deltaproteobacteria bacterium]